jgi:hypothetical protein
MLADVQRHPQMEIVGDAANFRFDAHGNLQAA